VALEDQDWLVRNSTVTALEEMGPGAKEAIPVLTKLLNDPIDVVRDNAAEALKKIRGEGAN
jgi:HEAT repeat protein